MFEKMSDQVLLMQVKALNAAEKFLSDERGNEFNDGGSANWAKNVGLGFAASLILFGLVKVFLPEIVDAWKAKVLEFFK